MGFGSSNQGSPLLRLHPLCLASFRPVDVLLAFGNQSYGAFNANLQAFLSKSQSKIFFRDEALGKVSEGVGQVFLREEVREEARQGSFRVDNSATRQIPMNFQ